MFLLRRPTSEDVDAFIRASAGLPLSYGPIGLARGVTRGFRVDESVTLIGSGERAFERASAALARWQHFELGWLHLYPSGAPTQVGTTVAVCINHFGFWSLNGCRIVYSIEDAEPRSTGFAYGTLSNHAERGEELFTVTLHPDGRVTYTIRAASRPRHPLAVAGTPLTRRLQARFRRDSTRAMAKATSGR